MKCPFCEGTGKCYQQTITYEEVETNRTNKYLTKCFKCNGTGEIEQTNEEWLRKCSTEELAELIVNLTLLDKYRLYDRFEAAEYERGIDVGGKQEAMKWLKEKHQ